MKHLFAFAIIAVVATGALLALANFGTTIQSDQTFQVAQRNCPNGRC
jgi:hypothetical protein